METGARVDEDHLPLAGDQGRQQGLGEDVGRMDVDPVELVEVRHRRRGHEAAREVADAVDQDVDAAKGSDGPRRQGVTPFVVGEIGGEGLDSRGEIPGSLGDPIEPLGVAPRQEQTGAFPRQGHGDGFADAAAGAGDHRDLAAERQASSREFGAHPSTSRSRPASSSASAASRMAAKPRRARPAMSSREW